MEMVQVTTNKQKVFHWMDHLFKDVGNARSTIMKLRQLDMATESAPWCHWSGHHWGSARLSVSVV